MEHTKGELETVPNFPGLLQIKGITMFCAFPNACRNAKELLQQKANAARLIKCWNCHDYLLEACNAALTERYNIGVNKPFWTPGVTEKINTAIAAAS